MKILATALALGMTLAAAPLAAPNAAAQRHDRFRAGVYVPSLFSEDKEVDCSIPRGATRFCVGLNASPRDRVRTKRQRARALRAARIAKERRERRAARRAARRSR